MCLLKVFSESDSFKLFAEKTVLPVYSVYEKSDSYKYRISFDVSDKEWDNFEGQVKDAIVFLEKYFDDLNVMMQSHNTSTAFLDFPIYSRLDDTIVNQNDRLPAKLIMLAGKLSLGIEMAIYSKNAFD